MKNVKLDLDDNDVADIIKLYIRDNFSKASYEVFKEDKNGYMIAAANALRNEAIYKLIEHVVNKNGNMLKT